MVELVGELNRLAGTEGLEEAGAANAYAGTSGLETLGALNEAAGTWGLGMGAVCNLLAGTSGLSPLAALKQTVAYDVLSAIDWEVAFYADDITGLADSDPVATWSDSSGNGLDATQGTSSKQPAYKAALAELDGQPAVQIDVGDAMRAPAFAAELVQPFTVVIVGRSTNGASYGNFVDGAVSSIERVIVGASSSPGNSWRIYADGSVTSAEDSRDTAAHLFVANFGDDTDSLEIDGASVASGNAGAQSYARVQLFSDHEESSQFLAGAVGFVGVYDGLLSTQQKDDLLAWSQDKYGTP